MMRFFSTIYFKVIAILAVIFLLCNESIVKHNKDFDVFIGASKLIFEGKTCYEVWLKSGAEGLKYFYSPLFAVLLFPLKDLPQVAYNFVWLSLNIALAWRLFLLLPFFLPLQQLTPGKRRLFYLLLTLAVGRPFHDTFSLGQMTIVLVWGSLESMRLFKNGRTIAGAALLALIINIKIIPVALAAYLLYKKELKAFGYTVAFSALYLLLPALVLGYEFNNKLLHDWLASLTTTSGNSLTDDNGRQSLSALVPALLMDTPLQFGLKRNLMTLEPAQVNFVLNAVRVAILILLAFLFGRPFRKLNGNTGLFYDVALVCLVTPLFFPHQGKYSYFYLFPAYAYSLYFLIDYFSEAEIKNRFIVISALVLVVISFVFVTLTTDGLIGRRLSDLCEYFGLIAIGGICLLKGMALLKPVAESNR